MRKYFVDIPRHYLGKLFHPLIEKRALRNRQAFYAGFVQPGALVFDLGANVSNRIDALMRIGAKVVAVDGYESEVLQGLHQPVPAISYEYCVPEQLDKALDCLELIAERGGDPECNYSVGESMVFVLPQWVSVQEMKTLIAGKKFIASSFGDIYVRQRGLSSASSTQYPDQ
jgi:hypothetical protein